MAAETATVTMTTTARTMKAVTATVVVAEFPTNRQQSTTRVSGRNGGADSNGDDDGNGDGTGVGNGDCDGSNDDNDGKDDDGNGVDDKDGMDDNYSKDNDSGRSGGVPARQTTIN
jgi:hypothetical protein